MHDRSPFGLPGLFAACLSLACAAAPASGGYTSTPVASLGGPTTQGLALNDDGTVVGVSSLAGAGPGMPFVAQGQSATDPSPGFVRGGIEAGISNTGHIAGSVDSNLHGTPIATLDGAPILGLGMTSRATGVNDTGLAVGQMMDPAAGAGSFEAQLQAGSATVLTAALHDAVTGNRVLGGATGVNDAGQVVGDLFNGHAFLFTPAGTDLGAGTVLDLGSVPALQGVTTRALAINASGEVLGTYADGSTTGGFLYDTGSVLRLPFTPAGINARGQVVGTTIDPVTTAVSLLVYDSRLGTTTDFSGVDLGGGFRLAGAAGINELGQILVNGTRSDPASPLGYDEAAFLLTPSQSSPTIQPFPAVPEPAGVALLAIGGLGLLAARVAGRRRPRHS